MSRQQSVGARQPLLPRSSADSLDELQPAGQDGGDAGRGDALRGANGSGDSQSMSKAVARNSFAGRSALSLQALGLVFFLLIWSLLISKMGWPLASLPLFGWHPLFQSLGLLLLIQSTSVLQPTTGSRPQEKGAAAKTHQWVNTAAAIVFTAGASIMWYLHSPGGHFISWHGIFGTATVVWMWTQAVIGAASVWSVGQSLLGGEDRAKSIWKWHRLSGYLLLPFFLLTLFTGATQTSWSQQNASTTYRAVITVVLIGVFAAGAARVQFSKLPKVMG